MEEDWPINLLLGQDVIDDIPLTFFSIFRVLEHAFCFTVASQTTFDVNLHRIPITRLAS